MTGPEISIDFGYFSIFEQFRFHVQLSCRVHVHEKSFITLVPGRAGIASESVVIIRGWETFGCGSINSTLSKTTSRDSISRQTR